MVFVETFHVSGSVQAFLETHQVPLLVPHGIIKQFVHRAIPAPSEGCSLVAPLFILLLCPQHLNRQMKTSDSSSLPKDEMRYSCTDQDKIILRKLNIYIKNTTYPIILRQLPGD